jgi:chromate transporter
MIPALAAGVCCERYGERDAVTLIGYHVGGVAGALVTTVAMCGPTAVLAHFLSRAWDRFKDAPWRTAVQAGVVPISVGLVAPVSLLIRASHRSAAAVVIATPLPRRRTFRAGTRFG